MCKCGHEEDLRMSGMAIAYQLTRPYLEHLKTCDLNSSHKETAVKPICDCGLSSILKQLDFIAPLA